MLQGIIIKKVLDLVMKQILKKFNLDKIQKYVEEPNDLDKKVKSLQKTVNKYGKYIEEVEKNVAILKKLAHPVSDFVCTDCGSKAKRVKNKLNKIKEKF